jgi:hypothetical protein
MKIGELAVHTCVAERTLYKRLLITIKKALYFSSSIPCVKVKENNFLYIS